MTLRTRPLNLIDMLLGQKLAMTANQNGAQGMFRYLGETTNFSDGFKFINRYSYFLQNSIMHDNKVLVYMTNCPHQAYTFFALAATKNIAIFQDPRRPEIETVDLIRDMGIKHIIISDDMVTQVDKMRKMNNLMTVQVYQCEKRRWGEYENSHRLPPGMSASDSDVVALFPTAGTSGERKWVPYTHKMIEAAVLNLRSAYRSSPADNFFSYHANLGESFHFIHGLMYPLLTGSGVTITDYEEPQILGKELRDAKVTRMIIPGNKLPQFLHDFVESGEKAPTIKTITPEWYRHSPAVLAALDSDTIKAKLLNTYGSVETCWATGMKGIESNAPDDGELFPGVQHRVLDTYGDDVPEKAPRIGQIVVKGNNVASGYYDNKAATQLNMRGGWHFTGDYVEIDKSAQFKYLERQENICVVRKNLVIPLFVEQKIEKMKHVVQAAVLMTTEGQKENLTVVIKPEPKVELTSDAVRKFIQENLLPEEQPSKIAFLKEIPMTPHGTIDKNELRFIFGVKKDEESA